MAIETLDQEKKSIGIKLSSEARRLREALAQKHGISKTAVIEMAIRHMAERDGVK
jgi:predicted transcriptional regulator